jgi:hypothetical protein
MAINSDTLSYAQLYVLQDDESFQEAVLRLDQYDVDEPFIYFLGAAAASTLTRSIVDDGDVTTATRVGWLQVFVQDTGNQIPDQKYYIPINTLA